MKYNKPIAAVVLELLVITTVVLIARQMDFIPYNVRELFIDKSPWLSVLSFWLLLNLLLGFPVCLACFHQEGGIKKHFLFPVVISGVGIIAWVFLKISVPMESVYDIVGTPILGWRWEFETIYRLIFLLAVPLVVFSFSAMGILYSRYFPSQPIDVFSIGCWVLMGLGVLLLSHAVVVVNAATDNLTELMAHGGGLISSAMIFLWLLNLGLFGSIISCELAVGEKKYSRISLILIVSCLIGYGLLLWGLENHVVKYGKAFSALQFLLSPNREMLVSGGDLFIRYVAVHWMLLTVLGVTQFPFWYAVQKRQGNFPRSEGLSRAT